MKRERRWEPTDPFKAGGVWWRVQPGRKGPDDLRLEWRIGDLWVPVPMAAGVLMADFFYENEDVLFPPPFAKGGARYMGALWDAAKRGWQPVVMRLDAERQARREQQERDLDDQGWAS